MDGENVFAPFVALLACRGIKFASNNANYKDLNSDLIWVLMRMVKIKQKRKTSPQLFETLNCRQKNDQWNLFGIIRSLDGTQTNGREQPPVPLTLSKFSWKWLHICWINVNVHLGG